MATLKKEPERLCVLQFEEVIHTIAKKGFPSLLPLGFWTL